MTTKITTTIQLKSGQVLTPTATTSTFMLYSADKLYRTNVRPLSSATLVNALCVENAYTKEIRWSTGGTPSSSFLPTGAVSNAQLVRGNLVVANVLGGTIFTSGLPDVNSSPNVLTLNADGSLSIIDPSSATQLERWRSFVYRLSEGQTIRTTMLYSSDNKYSGVLSGGKFQIVERATNVTKWSTEVTTESASKITALKFQGGNLIGTNSTGGILLHTGLPASTGSYFQVNNDGTASVYSSTGTVLWSTYCSLFMGQKLYLNQSLYTPDKTKRVVFGNFWYPSSEKAYLVIDYSDGNYDVAIVRTGVNASLFNWSTFPAQGDVSSDGYLQLLPTGELAMFNRATATIPFWKTSLTGNLGPVGLFITPTSDGKAVVTLSLLTSFGTTSDPKLWENGNLSTAKFKTVLTTNDGLVIKPFSQATFALYNTDYTTRFQLTDDGRLQVVNQSTNAVIWATSPWNLPGTSILDPMSQIVSASMSPVLTGYNSAGGVVFRANSTSSSSVFTLQVQGGSTGVTMAANALSAWDSRNTLVPGQKLMRGQSLRSVDSAVEFKFTDLGSLQIQTYAKSTTPPYAALSTPTTLWSTAVTGTSVDSFVTIGYPGSSLSGQLVVYGNATAITPLWSSGMLTQSVIANLVVTNVASSATEVIPRVQLVTNTNAVVWQNGGVQNLVETMSMQPGDKLLSGNSMFECILTVDGLFQIRNASTLAVVWSTATWTVQWDTTGAIDPLSKITSIKMTQGNLVGVNSVGKVIFDAGVTPASTSNTFKITDDGKGVIVGSNGITAFWRTDSALYPGQKLMRGQMLTSVDGKIVTSDEK